MNLRIKYCIMMSWNSKSGHCAWCVLKQFGYWVLKSHVVTRIVIYNLCQIFTEYPTYGVLLFQKSFNCLSSICLSGKSSHSCSSWRYDGAQCFPDIVLCPPSRSHARKWNYLNFYSWNSLSRQRPRGKWFWSRGGWGRALGGRGG